MEVLQKARLVIVEKVTKEGNGLLSMDPTTMEAQLLAFEKEIIEMGWAVQGKESSRMIEINGWSYHETSVYKCIVCPIPSTGMNF